MSVVKGRKSSPDIREVDVAIIGAGPAGLTAGYLLTKAGLSVAIIEKDSTYVGGISRTVEQDGYRYDVGGHRFVTKNQQVLDLWNEILPHELIRRQPVSRILFRRRFYSYPMRMREVVQDMGFTKAVHCLASWAKAKVLPLQPATSFEHWAINQYGEKLYSLFFKTYANKVWGRPNEKIKADWASERIRSLLDGTATQESFLYPRLGPGMMWEAARDKLEATGLGEVLMGHSLKQLASDGRGGWRMTASSPEGDCVITARHAISSAPLRDLVPRLFPLPKTAKVSASLRYRHFITVALKIKGKELFPDHWLHNHDNRGRAGRILNYRNWSPAMVPYPGITTLGLEYFCSSRNRLWQDTDEGMIRRATTEVERLGLVASWQVMGGVVMRQERAYPVYDQDSAKDIAAIRQELERLYPNLHLVGSNGLHRYHNMDHAMATAMLTVENILAEKRILDVWRVDDSGEYLGEGEDIEPFVPAEVGNGRSLNLANPAPFEYDDDDDDDFYDDFDIDIDIERTAA